MGVRVPERNAGGARGRGGQGQPTPNTEYCFYLLIFLYIYQEVLGMHSDQPDLLPMGCHG